MGTVYAHRVTVRVIDEWWPWPGLTGRQLVVEWSACPMYVRPVPKRRHNESNVFPKQLLGEELEGWRARSVVWAPPGV